MSEEPTFDPRRKAAIRNLVVNNAAGTPGRAGGHKRTALILTLVLLAVSISGGTVAYALGTGLLDPVAAPTATATPSATPTPTPTPTSTPPPTPAPTVQDPSDPATWVIGFDGVGPVKLGMPLASVNRATPTMSDKTYDMCKPLQIDLEAPDGLGLDVFAVSNAPGVVNSLHLGKNAPGNGPQPSAIPHTDKGIGLGSSTAELLAAYPGIPVTGHYSDSTTYYGLDDTHGTWIVFAVMDGAIYRITVGPSSGMPSEYCPA